MKRLDCVSALLFRWTILALSFLLSGCWFGRFGRDLDECSTSVDCPGGEICWTNDLGDNPIRVCVPPEFLQDAELDGDVVQDIADDTVEDGGDTEADRPSAEDADLSDEAGDADETDQSDDLGSSDVDAVVDVVEDLRNVDGTDTREEPDTAADPDTGTDPDTAADRDAATDADTAADRDAATDPDTAADPDTGTDPDTAADRDAATDPDTATDPDIASDRDMAAEPDMAGEPDMADEPDMDTGPDMLPEPIAQPDTFALNSGDTLSVPDPGVLENDTSFGGPLTAVQETSPSDGEVTLNEGGGFMYVNDGSLNLTDSFSYRAVDGAAESEPATVTFLINVAPAASDQNVVVPEGEAVGITLSATDANDDDLTFELVDPPSNGNLTDFDPAFGTVTYTPAPDFVGADAFTFRANDGDLDSNAATVALSVNGAPAFVSLPETQSTLVTRSLGPLGITIDDPDDALSGLVLSASSNRDDLVADENIFLTGTGASRNLTLVTEAAGAGIATIRLQLTDGVSVVTASLTVHVGVTHDIDDINQHGSIRRALDLAQSGDTFTFDPDHFNSLASEAQRTITLQGGLSIDFDLTILGPGDGLLILSGNDSVRPIYVAPGVTLGLSDLTISNGLGFDGGAIYNDGGQLSVSRTTIKDSMANDDGGAIFSDGGRVTILNVTLADNDATDNGGAVFNANLGEVIITDTTLAGNSASAGGAIYNSASGQLTINASTLSTNSATDGGGIYNENDGVMIVINSTLSGNSAENWGGAIYNIFSVATVINSTIVRNRADADGSGGNDGGGILHFDGPFVLMSTIVAGNLEGSGAGTPNEISSQDDVSATSAYNLIGDAASSSVLSDGDANGNIVGVDWTTVSESVLIGNGGPTQTHALLSSSPALDHIPLADCLDSAGNPLATDQRGEERPSGAACDIGAFERQPEDP